MAEDIAIRVNNITKNFKVHMEQSHSLKDYLVFHNRNKIQLREVIRGVSFDVKRGEAVALIGKNGCGKSTTLKMLTKILRPDTGSIEMNGRVSSLIELGAGFHPDMTGRENVYINASIFGLKTKEVDNRLDEIIRFSELEEFIDQPVRTYSSGMYMRLAFSVAINVSADILLIDEILAVGDASFQKKCFNKLTELKEMGTTIVIVSHSIDQVKSICDRAIWIYDGRVREDGSPNEVCAHYLDEMEHERSVRHEKELSDRKKKETKSIPAEPTEEEKRKKELDERFNSFESCKAINSACSPDAKRKCTGKVYFTHVCVKNANGNEVWRYKTNDSMTLEFDYESTEENLPISLSFEFLTQSGVVVYGTSTSGHNKKMIVSKKQGHVSCHIDHLPLLAGEYDIKVKILGEDETRLDSISYFIKFIVETEAAREFGLLTMEHQWITDNAERQS
nr:ABC transporter ATP-binding protein [uncultured Blautia sp.]